MSPIVPANRRAIDETYKRFMHEGGCLQAVTNTLAGHTPAGNAMQLLVDEGDQALEGVLVAAAPLQEQARDFCRMLSNPAILILQSSLRQPEGRFAHAVDRFAAISRFKGRGSSLVMLLEAHMENWSIWLRRVCSAGLVALAMSEAASADVLADWNQHALAQGGTTRTLAMVHLAMFDAVNAIQPRFRAYLPLPPAPSGANPEAAAAAAAHGVLVRLQPERGTALGAALAASLAPIPDGPGKLSGVQYGDLVADAMYRNRLSDNVLAPGPFYVSSGRPGVYQVTAPGPAQPVNTNARNWVPFALVSASQFRPPAPPALTSRRYARDLDETRLWGEVGSTYRTAFDDETARWHTELAQFQLNRIARTEVASDGKQLLEHLRLFALLNLALADASTSVFDAKYAYLFWRPVTAIRNADLDGNENTDVDRGWTPFLTTPPHPEYPAAHGTIQAAGARVLERYFGPHHAFAATSAAVPGITRYYEDFNHFAEEGGFARILGGMHFRHSIDVGHRQGNSVANWVLQHVLLPLE